MSAADEAKEHSTAHMEWMLALLKEKGGKTTYGDIVEVGEEHQWCAQPPASPRPVFSRALPCSDTVGALLKILKQRKVISYEQVFLMYPMHAKEEVTLIDESYDPRA